MIDWSTFEEISFEAERKSTGTRVRAHKYVGPAQVPVLLSPPDRPGFRAIQKTVVDVDRRDRAPIVVDAEEKHFDWAGGAHHQGGALKVRMGDYVVCEDGVFFALTESLFSEMFRRV